MFRSGHCNDKMEEIKGVKIEINEQNETAQPVTQPQHQVLRTS